MQPADETSPAAVPPGTPRPPHSVRGIETLDEFDSVVAGRAVLSGYPVQSVDLTARTEALLACDVEGAVFPGYRLAGESAVRVRAVGALVLPPVPGLPFDPYRGLLYTPDKLFDGPAKGYGATPDAGACAWFQRAKGDGDVFAPMLRAVHDDSVSDALDEVPVGARVVGDGDTSRVSALVDSVDGATEALAGPAARTRRATGRGSRPTFARPSPEGGTC